MQYYHFKNIQSALRIKKKKPKQPISGVCSPKLNACSHQRSLTSKRAMALPPQLFLSRECEDSSSKGALHFCMRFLYTLLHLPSCCPRLSGDTCSITAQIMCGDRWGLSHSSPIWTQLPCRSDDRNYPLPLFALVYFSPKSF